MDRRLQESVSRGDVSSLRKLVERNSETIIKRTVPTSLNTLLHLSARFGHSEYVKEVLKLCPEMASAENIELETPLHVACREGHLEIAKLLLEADPWILYKVNIRNETVFFVACERGNNIDVIKYLMNFPALFLLESDMGTTTSLHLAASSGNTEIVKEILQARADLARKGDIHGCTPLHLSCSRGQLEATREFLKLDVDLSLSQDSQGRTPLHHAVIKGRINVVDEVLAANLEASEIKTFSDETILHLAVKYNQYEVVKYLTERLNVTTLLNLRDCDGNTVLHLATAGKLTHMVNHLIRVGVDVNSQNRKGYTALDVVETDGTNSGALAILPALLEAGAKRCDQLSPGSAAEDKNFAANNNKYESERIDTKRSMSWPKKPQQEYYSPRRSRSKQIALHKEGLRNARKTITIVAVLIATVTFTAGINPPGGFSQETGKAKRGHHAAFKVFAACNVVALLLSIGIVNVLVSIIPITRKTMVRVLTATHKVMWVSTLFMIAAYIAGMWTIMPTDGRERWVLIETVVVGGGCTVLVLLGLGVMWARHLHNKYKWKKMKKMMNGESPHSNTSRVDELRKMKNNSQDGSVYSDVDSSDHGYILY